MAKKMLYTASLDEPFRLSRSKLDNFLKCPRCFYLDRKLGISQPSGAPFTLNNAVDALLKKEFDGHRKKGTIHPFVQEMGLNAIPYSHAEIENWRNNRIGIQYLHPTTNFLVFGAIDDVWVKPDGELLIVDYKAKATEDLPSTFLTPKTKKNGDIKKTERYKISYKKQLEIYQWLFRKNGFKVSNTAYFIFANAQKKVESFQDKLVFEKHLVAYEGDDSWVELLLKDVFQCLQCDNLPEPSDDCDECRYRLKAQQIENSSK